MLLRTSVLVALAFLVTLASAEPKPVQPQSVKAEDAGAEYKPAEAEWVFEPPQGRVDIMYDIETRLTLEKALLEKPDQRLGGLVLVPNLEGTEVEAALEWARLEAERVDKLILSRRWDEAIQACDKANKILEKYQDHAEIRSLRELFARSRSQAYEAKLFEEAKAQFDSLGIKVEGVLWSPEGSLAVLANEPKALRINDRTRDTTIVNIDTNRVDFLFTYQQRRFEFQRYVGEEVKGSGAATNRPGVSR